jgi:hypothetical protein
MKPRGLIVTMILLIVIAMLWRRVTALEERA